MQSEEWFLEKEEQLDALADQKALHREEGVALIAAYRTALLEMMFEINDREVDLAALSALEYKPLNVIERVDYFSQDKFHFMRYQQMKTMRQELKKLKAVMEIRKKRNNK
ncbi:YpoC family protein [Macrococcus equipercicus]|uniref:YpoC-like domain-containing protein n=1 Tax=Macrococcus equipercicus TaxID=69967 RepID=A0A9Q9BV19_9STAP|nr:hypothetical protein [Macrococcus equipercicus]KAA1040208.1 hypothetical protein ERX35_004250 [Macrococcus equipercicus]UTH12847.1 hypothetical protein KFV11_06050 [Macrococcus equipercicus]